jgi:hypothetical protein
MIEVDTRLRAARGIAKTETDAAREVFRTLHPSVPILMRQFAPHSLL